MPDLLVEQLALGELSEAEANAVREALGDRLEARLQALREDDAATLQRHAPAHIAAQIESRLAPRSGEERDTRRWLGWVGAGVLGAATLAAIVLLWTRTPDAPAPDGERIARADPADTVRIKGDPRIVLRRSRPDGGADPLTSGDAVSPGDMLLVALHPAQASHAVLVSLDGAGEVTLHFPAAATDPTAVPDGGLLTLHGFELDDAPRFERFLLVTADTPLDVQAVIEATASLHTTPDPAHAALGTPQGARVAEVLLERKKKTEER
ncbi:MAG: ActD protein [Nannocystaceae bacterium]